MEQQEVNQKAMLEEVVRNMVQTQMNNMTPMPGMQMNNMTPMPGMQMNNGMVNVNKIEVPIDYNGVQVKVTFSLPDGSGIEQIFYLLNMLESSGIRLYRYGRSGNRGFQPGNNQNYWNNNRNRF